MHEQKPMTKTEAIEALESGEKSIAAIAEITGWAVVDGCLVPEPETWYADDGNAEVEYPTASSAREAAEMYVADGDWGDSTETSWVGVVGYRKGIDADGDEVEINRESYTIAIESDEPDCVAGENHDWQSPHELVGGIKENPGVWGNGGGVVIHEVCVRCGCGRTTDTWAQDPTTGRQGLRSVAYEVGAYDIEAEECAAK